MLNLDKTGSIDDKVLYIFYLSIAISIEILIEIATDNNENNRLLVA